MLTPEYLQRLPDSVEELYAQAEADILADMARRINGFDLFIPSAQYQMERLEEMGALRRDIISKLSGLTDQIAEKTDELESAVLELKNAENVKEESFAIRDTVLGKMAALRAVADEAETQTSEKYWPFPTYGELLFSVK